MKHLILPLFAAISITGCSSATTPLRQTVEPIDFAAGSIDGEKTALYWITERFDSLLSSADEVRFQDNSWYQSQYSWDGSNLREVRRVGEQFGPAGTLVPFQVTLRFSAHGEAVYQQWRRDGKVMPMRGEAIREVKQQALDVVSSSREQRAQGYALMQGHWDDGVFRTCTGGKYLGVEAGKALPSTMTQRLQAEDNFAVFIGSYRMRKVVVQEMLYLKQGELDCIKRPEIGNS